MGEKNKSFLTDSSMFLQHMSARHVSASQNCVSPFAISEIEKDRLVMESKHGVEKV